MPIFLRAVRARPEGACKHFAAGEILGGAD